MCKNHEIALWLLAFSMCGHFLPRDEDGDHTIRSNMAEIPMLYANFMTLCEADCKFYIAGICIFDVFAAVTLTFTR